MRYVSHIDAKGSEFFKLACQYDLEGIIGKWKFGTYRADGAKTSWVKIKNPTYSQAEGRRELFEKRNSGNRRYERIRRELVLA